MKLGRTRTVHEYEADDGEKYRLILSGKYHDALWQRLIVSRHGEDIWTGVSHEMIDLLNKAARLESFERNPMEEQHEAEAAEG